MVVVLSAACNRPANDLSSKREIFDAGGQEVITSAANEQQGTMSILYGNGPAREKAIAGTCMHSPGEVFTLVTWMEVGNPHWYGTYINGRIKSVETVQISSDLQSHSRIDYTLAKGSGPKYINSNTIERRDRISFILNQSSSVFP